MSPVSKQELTTFWLSLSSAPQEHTSTSHWEIAKAKFESLGTHEGRHSLPASTALKLFSIEEFEMTQSLSSWNPTKSYYANQTLYAISWEMAHKAGVCY